MKVTAIQLKNIRGFRELPKTEFSENINIFIGPNNAGKSTILNVINFLQNKAILSEKDVTYGEVSTDIQLFLKDITDPLPHLAIGLFTYNLKQSSGVIRDLIGGNNYGVPDVPAIEPYNVIYPFLSKRKVATYSETVNASATNTVNGTLEHLYPKIDRINNPQDPAHDDYIKACKNILGFQISTSATSGGKAAGYITNVQRQSINLPSMGEGVGNILGLVESLCIGEDKIFIIEEPENDIHPKALKELLNLIKEKANQNQFFISTHSNIVMKQLGAMSDTKIFHVTNNQEAVSRGEIFTSSLVEVSDDPIDRRNILEDLGYEFSDLELWKGWLFLEESSAEILIRDYFIEWFAPKLVGKLRTFSASGVDKIKMKFDDFNSLFVFLHLEPTYKNKVWVLIDGGTKEQEILQKMKAAYISSGWNESNFSQLTEHDFEKYYPVEFQQAVTEILAIGDTKIKRARKKALLEEVKTWIIADEQRAKKEFSITAKEVIERLQEISDALR